MDIKDCQIGMTVIGNEKANGKYSITKQGWIGTIRAIKKIGQAEIKVVSEREEWWVEPEFFDIFEDTDEHDFLEML